MLEMVAATAQQWIDVFHDEDGSAQCRPGAIIQKATH
jgi:hypothetical protein